MKADKADSKNQIALLQAILSRIRLDNPKFKTLIEQEIRDNYTNGVQKEAPAELLRRLKIQNKKLLQRLAILKEDLAQSRADKTVVVGRLNELLKLNKSLSGALGSCGDCWGEDRNCPTCSGSGSPGWRIINRRLFNIYILPTLEKMYGLSKRIQRKQLTK